MLRQKPLTSLEEESDIATAAKVVYNESVKSLLSMHTWNFAIKQEKLTRITEKPKFRWEYQYQLPNDFITVVRLNNNEDYRLQGSAILTNEQEAHLTYVYNHLISDNYSPGFTSALIAYIANNLAYSVTGTSSVKEMTYMEFQNRLKTAMNTDDKQDYQEQIGQQSPLLLSARYR